MTDTVTSKYKPGDLVVSRYNRGIYKVINIDKIDYYNGFPRIYYNLEKVITGTNKVLRTGLKACSALIKTYNFYNTNPDKRDASLPDATIHGNYKNYQEVITLVENDFDDCIEASRIGSRTKSSLKGGSQGAFGAAWMILKDLDRNKANQFFEELIDEHTHKPDSPLKILHRTFYQSRGRIYHYKTLSLIFSAWNSWLNNENRKTLRVPPIVPEPIKP